jgi:hypothetical protein
MRSKTARQTAKTNSKQIRNVGSTRSVLGVRLPRPQTELLRTEAIRACQIEAVVRQHDRFLGDTGAFPVFYSILTPHVIHNSNDSC